MALNQPQDLFNFIDLCSFSFLHNHKEWTLGWSTHSSGPILQLIYDFSKIKLEEYCDDSYVLLLGNLMSNYINSQATYLGYTNILSQVLNKLLLFENKYRTYLQVIIRYLKIQEIKGCPILKEPFTLLFCLNNKENDLLIQRSKYFNQFNSAPSNQQNLSFLLKKNNISNFTKFLRLVV